MPAEEQQITSWKLANLSVALQAKPNEWTCVESLCDAKTASHCLNLKAGKFRASTKYLFCFQSWASGSHYLNNGCLFSEHRCAYSTAFVSVFPSCFPHECVCSFLAIYFYPLNTVWGTAVPSLIQVAITFYKFFSALTGKALPCRLSYFLSETINWKLFCIRQNTLVKDTSAYWLLSCSMQVIIQFLKCSIWIWEVTWVPTAGIQRQVGVR